MWLFIPSFPVLSLNISSFCWKLLSTFSFFLFSFRNNLLILQISFPFRNNIFHSWCLSRHNFSLFFFQFFPNFFSHSSCFTLLVFVIFTLLLLPTSFSRFHTLFPYLSQIFFIGTKKKINAPNCVQQKLNHTFESIKVHLIFFSLCRRLHLTFFFTFFFFLFIINNYNSDNEKQHPRMKNILRQATCILFGCDDQWIGNLVAQIE